MFRVSPGLSYPLGASVAPDGVDFAIFSQHAISFELLFFDDVNDARPSRAFILDATENSTFYYWHIFVHDARPGQIYACGVYGP